MARRQVAFGLDLSPSHFAFVRYGADMRAWVGAADTTCRRIAGLPFVVGTTTIAPLPKEARLEAKLVRLMIVRAGVAQALAELHDAATEEPYVAIEDYAYANAFGAHQIGETSGICRVALWQAGARIRLYNTKTIKAAISGNGDASKLDVLAAAVAAGAPDLRPYDPKKKGGAPRPAPKKERDVGCWLDPSGDLYDAWSTGWLANLELRLRAGEIAMADLPKNEREALVGANVLMTPWTPARGFVP